MGNLAEKLYVHACRTGRRERQGLPVEAEYWRRKADDLVCALQGRLLEMTLRHTTTVLGVVVTRWAKDCFELDTVTGEVTGGSEWAAEEIASRRVNF